MSTMTLKKRRRKRRYAGFGGGTPAALFSSLTQFRADVGIAGPHSRIINGTARMVDKSGRDGTARQNQPGRSWELNGTSDFVALDGTLLPTTALAISAWVRVTSTTNYNTILCSSSVGGLTNGAGLLNRQTTRIPRFYIDNWNNNFAEADAALTLNAWTHVLGTWDGTNILLYVDGVLQAITDTYSGSVTHQAATFIGKTTAAGTWWFPGQMSDVRVFNYAPTALEAAAMAAMGPNVNATGPDDALLHFKADEGAGTTAINSGSLGSAGNGTITAAALSTFHNKTTNSVYSWQNEKGYNRATGYDKTSADAFDGIVEGELVSGDITIDYIFSGNNGTHREYIGLTDSGTITAQAFELAYYTATGTIRELTSDVLVHGAPSAGDHIRIERVGTTGRVYVNGSLVYTSGQTLSQALRPARIAFDLANGYGLLASTGGDEWTTTNATLTEGGFPRAESDKSNDALGTAIRRIGRAPHDAVLSSPCGTFDGTADIVDIGGAQSSMSKAADFSGSITFYATDDVTRTLLSATTGVSDRFGVQVKATDTIIAGVWNGTTYAAKSATIALNQWHTLTWSYDSTGHTMTATLDGDPISGSTTPTLNSTAGAKLGADTASGFFYQGRLKRVAIDGGSEWVFDNGDGTTIYDISGASVHGTLTTASQASFWANKQNLDDTLAADGYRRSGGSTIPALADGSAAADGNPLTHGPGVFAPGQSMDLAGGEPDSPYAQQIDAILADLDVDQGDNNEADSYFERVTSDGSDRIAVVVPAATGGDLATLNAWSA